MAFKYVRTGTGELSGKSFVEQTEALIDDVVESARQTREIANAATLAVDSAKLAASSAVDAATEATATATETLTTAQAAESLASAAESTAENAVQKAEEAKAIAQSALETARGETVATQTTPGLVKPDNETLTVAADGALSVINGTLKVERRVLTYDGSAIKLNGATQGFEQIVEMLQNQSLFVTLRVTDDHVLYPTLVLDDAVEFTGTLHLDNTIIHCRVIINDNGEIHDNDLDLALKGDLSGYLPITGGHLYGKLEFDKGEVRQGGTGGETLLVTSDKDNPFGSPHLGLDRSTGQAEIASQWHTLRLGNNTLTFANKEVERVTGSSSRAEDGYIRFESGLQICWGQVWYSALAANSTNRTEITFPQAFANTNYRATVSPSADGGNTWHLGVLGIIKYAGKMSVGYRNGGTSALATTGYFDYIAIGTWK